MLKPVFLLCFFLAAGSPAFSQQLALNECGIVNVYDNAGNRTKREYYCNNGLAYPSKIVQAETKELMEFQPVEALFPNPTTGRFSVTFSKALDGAQISLTDVNGKVVQQFKASGNRIDFNLSAVAAGVYLVRIEDNGRVITKKVVKQ
jgi:hypothetical protein